MLARKLVAALELRERSRSLASIVDLAPVPGSEALRFVVLPDLFDPATELTSVELEMWARVFQPLEVDVPDLLASVFVELLVVQRDVDAGFEGLVEGADFVGRQETVVGKSIGQSL